MADPGPDVLFTRTVSKFSCAIAPPATRWTFSGRRVHGAVFPGSVPPSRRYDTLPQVVIGTILEWLSRDDCFWRCVTAMHMAQSLSMVTERPLRIIPLSWLVSWERGSPPKVASEEAAEGLVRFIRFTIDRDGMSKFERMSERPQFNRERFDDKVFVVEREDVFGASLAMFKEYKWSVWDTPTPPDLAPYLARPEKPLSMLRYHSINLAAVTGITFFVFFGRVFGVHAHSRAQPCAMASYQAYGKRRRREMDNHCAWVYVPLASGDTVRALGQCQLHVDPSDTFERPFRIAFLNVTTFPGYTEVLFDKLPSADDPQLDDWLYYEMAGTLNFWFSTSQGHMAVQGGREIPQTDLWEEVPPEELLLMKQVGEDS
ncbi:hypothetical protein CHGG_04121 [Chaetomium globosum CBS 148.51]|uniref:Uncharacterized protein n=1 Tax=Chaetomium globosum (strain ATCC 6205 / CBS 148.51 / DSM 1962 / NBRC 6347 / NRRL 1970) TaxID=306901 RepID=Q2H275_CHAGB|nr:uncharacterized protein CHGG_04121 [Chaetomium globosum CBS 148.51]EAQ87502.1 hypothetical protein CHGG_04121 [Chaetomium globosum CBS 148.51]